MLIPCPPARWYQRAMKLWRWSCLVVLVVACTKRNPEVCCLDPDDCASIGVSDPVRECAEGLACVDNACQVASCSTDGCSAEAPVCDITLDVCKGCMGPADCDQFATTVCDTESGACVGCVANEDCDPTTPVCDARACRECRLDSECASGACDEDGTCVLETNVVYLDPTGTDSGTCTRASPCFQLQFALTNTGSTRTHIVMNNGTYTYTGVADQNVFLVSAALTTAVRIDVHGGGSKAIFAGADGQAMFDFSLPSSIVDLNIEYGNFGRAVVARAPTRLRRVTIKSETGIEVRSTVDAQDISVLATGGSSPSSIVVVGGSLNLARAVLKGGDKGISATAGSILELENVLISDTTETGVDLIQGSATTASLAFVTIVRTGTSLTTGVAGLICPNANTSVRSTIVWTPTNLALPAISGCALSTAIVGPVGAVGAQNVDPEFVDFANENYHLSDISPAKDLVDVGPNFDFEGDPRPNGERFDIGADEIR